MTLTELQDRDVVIASTVRPDDLAALVIRAAVSRAGVSSDEIEEVILGCANQAGEDNRNEARMAALLAGLPHHVGGLTVNRLCASGLSAVNTAARAIRNGDGDVYVAGGVESMTRAPLVMPKGAQPFASGNVTAYDTTLGWRFPNPAMETLFPLEAMGETAERSGDEIMPIEVKGRRGLTLFDTDEHPRVKRQGDAFTLATDEATLAALKPAFRKGGSVTAGNASGLNDGAAALVLMGAGKARELGVRPLARWVGAASAGVDPRVMGLGPVPTTRKLMDRLGMNLADVDLVEINEAFAAQVIACMRELGVEHEQLNIHGGSIALGHPLGMSGARLVTTLTHELNRREGRYGVVSLCVGVGQGESALIERVEA